VSNTVTGRILLIDIEKDLYAALGECPVLDGCRFECAAGSADALRRIRVRPFDVAITSPATAIEEDLALLEEMREIRPGVRAILLAAEAPPAEIIAALRAQVFACFTAPFTAEEVAAMTRRAIDESDWRHGMDMLCAQPGWLSVRVNCRLLNAERLVQFLKELPSELPPAEHESLMLAFREIVLNAMEHGAGFNPEKVVEVAAVRIKKAILFYIRDPGPGFRRERMAHAAAANDSGNSLAHIEVRAEYGLRPGGYGLLLAKSIVDELLYTERGNEVLLVKYVE